MVSVAVGGLVVVCEAALVDFQVGEQVALEANFDWLKVFAALDVLDRRPGDGLVAFACG